MWRLRNLGRAHPADQAQAHHLQNYRWQWVLSFGFDFEFWVEDQQQYQGSVRFEIEGGGEVLTSFVRKNEEEFFEFLVDFNKDTKSSKKKPFSTNISVRKKPTQRMSMMSKNSRSSRLGMRSRQGAVSPNLLGVKSRVKFYLSLYSSATTQLQDYPKSFQNQTSKQALSQTLKISEV